MKKTTIQTTIYNYDGNFYVDIVEQNNLIEFWLYHKNYGRKNLMFGMDKRYIKYIESIILANIDRSIALYKIDYMQDSEKDNEKRNY